MNGRVALLLLIIAAGPRTAAQQDDSTAQRPALYLEALGPGGLGSINYEHPLIHWGRVGIRLRAGMGGMRFRDFTGRPNPDLTMPVGLLLGWGKHWGPEIGGGATLTSMVLPSSSDYRPKRRYELHGWLSAGIRWGPGRWLLRLAYDPVISFGRWQHWGGLSIGMILR
ncbi:MAG: hypothetical protein JST41_12940 [Bacteroidetes bacterium]|nr:hypothetical protein [Bacteroidota bacterium]MBX7129158.1 hypothetical protein [Flavobacteriales bacterium]MCC6655279.1 hypothetical protein [Flavobacteriales bacterium]HMU15409.1 hypothetical protein [Flavobacteriales bacterium]HMW98086.1 hypothetical protein [Flavobacteriales bacterium]